MSTQKRAALCAVTAAAVVGLVSLLLPDRDAPPVEPADAIRAAAFDAPIDPVALPTIDLPAAGAPRSDARVDDSRVDVARLDAAALAVLVRDALASDDPEVLLALLTTLSERLQELADLHGVHTLRELLLPLIEAALRHEGDVDLAQLAFALLADLDPELFRERMLAAAFRPSAGTGLIGGVLSALEGLSPADGRDALSAIGTGQFAMLRARPPGDDSLETDQRRLFAAGSIHELIRRMPPAELGARLADPDTDADERLLLAATASAAGVLGGGALAPEELGALAEAVGAEVSEELARLSGDDVSEGTETLGNAFARIRLLNELPNGAGRSQVLDLLGSSTLRRDLLQATAREVSRDAKPELFAAALVRMQALAPESSGRAGLAQAFFLAGKDRRPSVAASAAFVRRLEETLTGSGGLEVRGAALDMLLERSDYPGAAEVVERLRRNTKDPLAAELRRSS